MQNNPEIEQIIDSAIKIAQDHSHEYMLSEHLLLSLIRHEPFRKCLEKYGVEIEQFDRELDAYITSLVNLVKPDVANPKKTEAIVRIVNRAFTQVSFTGRTVMTTIDL